MNKRLLFVIALLATAALLIHLEIRHQKALQEISSLQEENEDLQSRLETALDLLNRLEGKIERLNKENAQLKSRSAEQKTSRGSKRLNFLGEYIVTAYCACEKCCGQYAQNRPEGKVYGAAGVELTPGLSVAAPLPFGTEVYIDGRRYVVQDRTAGWVAEKYNGRIIDLYVDSHAEALAWGRQVREVYVREDRYK